MRISMAFGNFIVVLHHSYKGSRNLRRFISNFERISKTSYIRNNYFHIFAKSALSSPTLPYKN